MEQSTNPYFLSNQGVEYFENQNYGKAIAKFYQAKRLSPRDSIITNNINVLDDEIQLKQPPLVTFNLLNLSESLILLLIFSLLFVFRKFIHQKYIIQFGLIILFLFSALLTLAVAVEQKFQKFAAITEPSIKAYSGNSENNEELFELLDGQIIKVISREKNWSAIEYDGRIGWVRNAELEAI